MIGLPGNLPGEAGVSGRSSAEADPAACTVSVTLAGLPLIVTGEGWKLQVAMAGRPLHENCSVPVYPFSGVMVRTSEADPPGATKIEGEANATVTEGGGVTVRVKPWDALAIW
jgi:hypothetical protein